MLFPVKAFTFIKIANSIESKKTTVRVSSDQWGINIDETEQNQDQSKAENASADRQSGSQ